MKPSDHGIYLGPSHSGARIGLSFIYFADEWASLVAQTVKNLPAVQETWVPSLGREGPLEKGMATSVPQYSCLENSVDRGAW